MTRRTKSLLLISSLVVAILVSWMLVSESGQEQADRIIYSELISLAKEARLKSTVSTPLILTESGLTGKYLKSGSAVERKFEGVIPEGSQKKLADALLAQGLIVEVQTGAQQSWTFLLLSFGLPVLLIAGAIYFAATRLLGRRGGSGLNAMRQSRAKLWMTSSKKVTFLDVAGAEEAKEELQEVVEFLRNPGRFQKLGAKIPRGVLMTGPPGTGKTLLARAVAGEASVPFFSISGSEFVEMFVGVGASRVRNLFEVGKRHAPCLVFIDEIDSIGRRRGSGLGSGHDEREQALNQLLSEMDGFESGEGVIVLGATNRPDILDPALLRPGRFDRHVVFALPDSRGREGILRVHLRGIPLSADVEIPLLARSTPGFSGAQLESLVNEAALRGARFNRDAVTMDDFLEEKDRSTLGRERKSLVVSAAEKKRAAYREAGHALVAWLLPEADPVQKVTIVPRADDIGTTVQVPEDGRHRPSKQHLESAIAILMARRCTEEIFLRSTSSAVAKDLREATELARRMVCEWGMAEDLGPLALEGHDRSVFLGTEITRRWQYGEATAARIDQAVKRVVLHGAEKARSILESGRGTVVRLADALLESGTLDTRQLVVLIGAEENRCRAQEVHLASPMLSVPSDTAGSPSARMEHFC